MRSLFANQGKVFDLFYNLTIFFSHILPGSDECNLIIMSTNHLWKALD